jgi:hypothetical protein
VRWLALAVLVSSAGAANRDAIAELPELATIAHGRARVTVRGDLSRARAKQAVQLVDAVIADVERRFTQPAEHADAPVVLCLLGDDASYRDVAGTLGDIPSAWGFYRPDRRVAIANFGQSIGNLRHELVHPLLGDDFPAIPAWLNEGIAALYGTSRPTRRGFEFLVNYRLRDLQRALARGDLPTIGELAESTDADVRGPRAAVYYAMSRYVLLYLDRRGKLEEAYAALRAASGDVAKQRAILERFVDERAFGTWARSLRY